MKVLGIETSTRMGTLAVVQGKNVLAEDTISDNLRHAGSFETVLERLFSLVGFKEKDLDAVAVGLGPGSFTGIRVGLTIAKGLGFVFEKPILGVGTLDLLAHQFSFPYARLCPIIPGEGREVYGALYEKSGHGIRKVVQEFNVPVENLGQFVTEPAFVFGPGLEKVGSEIRELLGQDWVDQKLVFPSAGSVALLAQNPEWRVEGEQVIPRYVKPPQIRV